MFLLATSPVIPDSLVIVFQISTDKAGSLFILKAICSQGSMLSSRTSLKQIEKYVMHNHSHIFILFYNTIHKEKLLQVSTFHTGSSYNLGFFLICVHSQF